MRKHLYILIALIALVASACSAPIPEPGDADWCYTYDFTTSLYGATIDTGSWIPGVGVQSVSGDFNLTLNHSQTVAPFHIAADVLIESVGDVSFSATGDVFGIALNYADTLPDYIESATLSQPAQFSGVSGNTASLNFASNADLVTIQNLTIYGNGVNPFPSNNCGATGTSTSTPDSIFTDTPTPTATNTPTATATSTATTTATPLWCHVVDFRISDGGWNVEYGDWQAGIGWVSAVRSVVNPSYTSYNNELSISYPFGGALETGAGSITYSYVPDPDASVAQKFVKVGVNEDGGSPVVYINQFDVADTSGFVTVDFGAGSSAISSGSYYINMKTGSGLEYTSGGTNGGWGGLAIVQSIRLSGSGINPFGVDNCDITPTPSNTPDITPTSVYDTACIFLDSSFNFGEQFWTVTGDTRAAAGSLIVSDAATLQQSVGVAAGRYSLAISTSLYDPGVSASDGTVGIDYTVSGATDLTGSFSADESQYSDFLNFLAFTDEIVLSEGTNDFEFVFNLDSVSELQLLTVCLTQLERDNPGESTPEATVDPELTPEVTATVEPPPDGGGGGDDPGGDYGTCGDVISAPANWTDIGGWITFLWKHLIQFFECTLIPLVESIVNELIYFFLWLVTVAINFINWVWKLYKWLESVVRNLFIALFVLLFNAFIDSYSLLNAIWETVNLYLAIANMYLQMFVYQLQALVNAYNNAPYIPPPGVPDCINNAAASDLCAFHWTIENTLLSDAAGALIVPALIVLVDLVAVFLVINMIRGLIKNVSETLND